DGLDGFVKLFRRGDGCFENRLQDADGGAQPEIGSVEEQAITAEAYAATAGSHVNRAQRHQLSRKDGLETAGTGGEEEDWNHQRRPRTLLTSYCLEETRRRLPKKCLCARGVAVNSNFASQNQ